MNMNKLPPRTAKHLHDTRKLISSEKNWCKGTLARDAQGNEISPEDLESFSRKPTNCQFCAMGALLFVTRNVCTDSEFLHLWQWLDELAAKHFSQHGRSISAVNDRGGHKTVLSLLGRAVSELN